jgi:hypothetical protein
MCPGKMIAVMKAMAFIRKSKGLTQRAKLVVAEVERVSAAYSSDKKPVLKGNWTTKRARKEWLDIKKAIDGTLKPDDHLVWQAINSFSDTLVDPSGLFASKFKQYEETIKNLEDEKKRDRKKHDDLYKLCLTQQYLRICDDDVIEEVIANSDKIRNESRQDIKTIQEYQKMVKKYEMDNDKYLRREALPGAVDKAKYRLFQPDFSLINTLHGDGELKIFYVTQVLSSMYEGAKIQIDKKRPEDIVFVYHHFNIEDH